MERAARTRRAAVLPADCMTTSCVRSGIARYKTRVDGPWNWLATNWQFLASVVITVVIAFGIYYLQRQPKTLDYEVRTKVPLLSPAAAAATSGLSQPIKLLHGDAVVSEPYLITLRIRNTGKRAVERADYVEPIVIRGAHRQPFDGFLSAARPKGLKVTDGCPLFESDTLELRPIAPPLLNKGDWFDLQLLFNGNPGLVRATSRFKDQSRPMRDQSRQVNDLLPPIRSVVPGAALVSFPLALLLAVATSNWSALGLAPILLLVVLGNNLATRRFLRRALTD